ncbi:oligopeptide/dipeptide ABC transporter ATP-binding protein [Actinomadura sp. BRA 177]|uniref:oligopeptide/dipeptide ABC transporter ATP-binding protein n=1 Tax=Actinomadura sp. BRA 177 TaxID=2745202 RepID=UPI001594FA1A|nr:oligopeptide/dipeptide ABC transporter ATP-binding protein [Actinomadura sp. BRA 177]NVI92781.1 ATP-binding cassette domain-containing protein [Actinomadura sp. BRA 177]
MTTSTSASPPSEAPLIDLDRVTRRFALGKVLDPRKRRIVHAVEDVSLSLGPGETLAIVGESGCGKSTLARLAVGLLRPTMGEVRIGGVPAGSRLPRGVRRTVQFVSQNPWSALNRRKSIGHAIGQPLAVHGLGASDAERAARVHELLEQVGLPPEYAERRPGGVSGGELQRATVARALAASPRAIVLDGPTASLDVGVKATLVNLLLDLRESLGLGYVLITHELDIARHLATHVAVMYLGRVVEWGPAEEIFAAPRHPYTRTLLAAIPEPDPARRELPVLTGEVPSAVNPPPGCAFHPRCPYAVDRCAHEMPELVSIGERRSACLRDAELLDIAAAEDG